MAHAAAPSAGDSSAVWMHVPVCLCLCWCLLAVCMLVCVETRRQFKGGWVQCDRHTSLNSLKTVWFFSCHPLSSSLADTLFGLMWNLMKKFSVLVCQLSGITSLSCFLSVNCDTPTAWECVCTYCEHACIICFCSFSPWLFLVLPCLFTYSHVLVFLSLTTV